MIPYRYLIVKDDIPGLEFNTMRVEGSDHPMTVPVGHDYLEPLSMHGEITISEFVPPPTRTQDSTLEKKKSKPLPAVTEAADTSDFLYSAYTKAQKGKSKVKIVRRMKSQSPPR